MSTWWLACTHWEHLEGRFCGVTVPLLPLSQCQSCQCEDAREDARDRENKELSKKSKEVNHVYAWVNLQS